MGINANISTKNIKKNNSQKRFNLAYILNGYGALIPIIDGVKHPELMMGYVSEADAKAGLRLIEMALEETNGDVSKVRSYIMNAMNAAAEKPADKEIVVHIFEI